MITIFDIRRAEIFQIVDKFWIDSDCHNNSGYLRYQGLGLPRASFDLTQA